MNILKIIGIAAGVAVVGAASLAIMNPTNIAETSADAKEEALRPRIYKTDLQNFIGETEKIIAAQTTYGKSWKFILTDTKRQFGFDQSGSSGCRFHRRFGDKSRF